MWNPTRRNRKIGKTQGGRVKDGQAREKRSRFSTQDVWTKLSEHGGELRVLREPPAGGTFHPCTGDEYLAVLARLPAELCAPLKAIVLRRTTKIEQRRGVEASKRYRCVILNSFPTSRVMPFSRFTRPCARHYAPWCRKWSFEGDGWRLTWSVDELRRYYLYHLFLHELGHLHEPAGCTRRRGEAFAENFALEWARRLGELTLTYDQALAQLIHELPAYLDEWLAERRREAAAEE